jgi:DDE family transposase
LGSRQHFTDVHALHPAPERVAVDVVAIAEEIGGRGVVREGVHDLLGRPGGRGMFGHIEVQDPAAMVGEHDQDEEDAQMRGGNREEIDGDQIPDMVGEERAPSLRRRYAPLRHQPGDGALSYVDPELQKFAVDSRGAPQGIRLSHSGDEGPDLGTDGRAARGGPAGKRRPVQAKATPLPAQNSVGRDDDESRSPARPHPGQPSPEEAIGRPQSRPRRSSLVHDELLAQGQVLDGDLTVPAAEEGNESKKVKHMLSIGRRLSPAQSRKINDLSAGRVLARHRYREGDKVKNRTLANLTKWPAPKVDLLRRLLRDEPLAPVDALFEVVASSLHGHVQAVRTTMQRLGLEGLIASRPSRERTLVVGMVVARILEPDSKLATTRWWHTTTLPADLGLSDADEDALYEAMDWLLARQAGIEQKLAARHLRAGGFVLYDLTSSYFEGTTCPLAAFGHNRDGKKGKLQVNYGLLTDARGCPIAVSVYTGNTGDPPTLLPEVQRVRERFGIERLVIVGDRGMISQTQITALTALEGVAWITALKTGAIRDLVSEGHLQLGLFDDRNLFELAHPDFPGERLVACRNPELAKLRAHKRQALLAATVKELAKVQGMVARGTLKGRDAIGVRVGKVVNKYKVAKHVRLEIHDDRFEFQLDEAGVAAEAALDGLYVIRTSVPAEHLDAADAVRHYKRLSDVERAFRSLKTIDLKVRPIGHRLEDSPCT